MKNRVRPDDERCPRRDPEVYEFPEYDRMVESPFFKHHSTEGTIDKHVDMVWQMYAKNRDQFRHLLIKNRFSFNLGWFWYHMNMKDEDRTGRRQITNVVDLVDEEEEEVTDTNTDQEKESEKEKDEDLFSSSDSDDMEVDQNNDNAIEEDDVNDEKVDQNNDNAIEEDDVNDEEDDRKNESDSIEEDDLNDEDYVEEDEVESTKSLSLGRKSSKKRTRRNNTVTNPTKLSTIKIPKRVFHGIGRRNRIPINKTQSSNLRIKLKISNTSSNCGKVDGELRNESEDAEIKQNNSSNVMESSVVREEKEDEV